MISRIKKLLKYLIRNRQEEEQDTLDQEDLMGYWNRYVIVLGLKELDAIDSTAIADDEDIDYY